MDQLTETRVEQSFNERLFAEIFDYRTLYRHGAGEYHLEPKKKHPNGRYDDFALGFVSPSDRHFRVSAELKSPRVDLDAAQANYDGLTPVQQAFRAAGSNPDIRWIIVSNFDEVRLYHQSSQEEFERIVLSDVLSIAEFRRVWVLLSRTTLLGKSAEHDAPLDELLRGDFPMVVPKIAGQARLVHQVVFSNASESELPFHIMDGALRAALEAAPKDVTMWPLRSPVATPRVAGDRLVVNDEVDGLVPSTIELSRFGVLRLSEYLNEDHAVDNGHPILNAADLSARVGCFIVFAKSVAERLYDGEAGGNYTWEILDVDGAICGFPASWFSDTTVAQLPLRAGISYTRVPVQSWTTGFAAMPLARHTAFVVRELLFPFEMRNNITGAVARLDVHENQIEHQLKKIPYLAECFE
jgi:hypothetical protein